MPGGLEGPGHKHFELGPKEDQGLGQEAQAHRTAPGFESHLIHLTNIY